MTLLSAMTRSLYQRSRQRLVRLFSGPDLREVVDLAEYRSRLDLFLAEDAHPLPPLNFVDPRQRRIAPATPAPVAVFPARAPDRDSARLLPAPTLAESA